MKSNLTRILLLLSFLTSSLVAGPVLYWSDQVLNATRLSRNPPPVAALHLATFHVAIFDALNGFDQTYQPWLVNEAAPAGSASVLALSR